MVPELVCKCIFRVPSFELSPFQRVQIFAAGNEYVFKVQGKKKTYQSIHTLEIIIAVLISQFRLSLSKEEIVWEMGTLVTPAIKGQPGQPRMPMVVELL